MNYRKVIPYGNKETSLYDTLKGLFIKPKGYIELFHRIDLNTMDKSSEEL